MRVLITGGTGSLGRALTSHYLKDESCSRLVIYSRDEWKQAEMAKEFTHPKIRYFLGDVRDQGRLAQALHGVDCVIHAAALKRVDSVAYNPGEVIKTNVYGTMNVIEAAVSCGVKKVMLISSDKAVEPTNIYGASKMMAEHYAIYANTFTYPRGTLVACVRYGNVLGSRGSVVSLFKDAFAAGRLIPITDPACTRFLITMSQAVEFVTGCIGLMEGGEIFVPKLPSVRILDLMQAVCGEKAMWERVGLRNGGEKLHESLINSEEGNRASFDGLATITIPPTNPSWRKLEKGRYPFSAYRSNENGFLTVDEIRSLLALSGC